MTAITTANVTEAFDKAADRYDMMVGLIPGYHDSTVFLHDQRQIAIVNLSMITAGFFVATNYLRDLDRGR